MAPPAFTSKLLERTIYACFHFTVPSLLLKVEDSSKGTAGREVRSSLGWLDSHPNTASGNTLFLEDITIWSLDLYTSKNHIFPELELIWPISRFMMIKLILIYKHVFQYQFIIRIHTCFLWTRILMPTRFTIAFCFFPQLTTEVKFLYSFLSILKHTFFFFSVITSPKSECFLQLTVFYSYCQPGGRHDIVHLKLSVDLAVSQKVKQRVTIWPRNSTSRY